MSRKYRRFRPSPALIVALIALFVAMGGVGYSAVKLKKNAVKTKNIKDGAVTTPKLAKDAVAPNAAKLNGLAATGYQTFCGAGTIKGSLVINTTNTTPATYTNVTGFNCALPGNTTSSVQVKRNGLGDYNVKFLGPTTSGSAVISGRNLGTGLTNVDNTGVAGEFHVQTAGEPSAWSLVAF